MFDLNTEVLKSETKIQKNVLYRIDEDRIISIREEHDHCTDAEIVHLEYRLKDGQYAVFGKEYRPPSISKHGCKSTDVLTCLIDDKDKKIYSLILDVKRNMSAFSDDLLKDGAILSAIKEVRGFIEQLHHTVLHKESFLVYYKDSGYTETAELGIATKRFENEKFLEVADFLEKLPELENPSNMQPLLFCKLKNNLMPYMSEAVKMREFANKKVTISGNLYQLHVYLLKWLRESEYAVSIEIKMDEE